MQETWVQSLDQEDPLEEEMATHFSSLGWKFPWMEEPGRYSPRGHKESDTTERLHFHFSPGDLPGPGIEPKSPALLLGLPLGRQGSHTLTRPES